MENNTKINLLKDEYSLLQRFYEDLDGRALNVKGWSGTVAVAAIGVGFYQSKYLWLFAAGASLVFWMLEALWKSFQYMYVPRIDAIEQAFRTDEFENIVPFQIRSSWMNTFRMRGLGVGRVLALGIVSFPHAITFVVGLLLFVLEASGILTIQRSK